MINEILGYASMFKLASLYHMTNKNHTV